MSNALIHALQTQSSCENPLDDPPAAEQIDGRIVLDHPMLVGTQFAKIGIVDGIDDDGTVLPHAVARYDEALRDVVRRQMRLKAFAALDDGSPASKQWSDFGLPPTWALLTHPLFAYALRMHGIQDTAAQLHADDGLPAGVRIGIIQDLMVGRASLDPRHPVAKVGCDDMGAVLEVNAVIPESTRHMLRGRPLSSLIEIRPSGDARVDALAGNITILHVDQFDDMPVATITFVPATWLPTCPAPFGIDMKAIWQKAPCR